jgi:hypothetical protein
MDAVPEAYTLAVSSTDSAAIRAAETTTIRSS